MHHLDFAMPATPATDRARFALVPGWLILAASPRAVRTYAAMALLGDWRKHIYQHGSERLAGKLSVSVDTVTRGIEELLELRAITPKRRIGTTTIFTLCKPDEPRPSVEAVAAASTGDTRNTKRGTRERVEDWTGARLAQHFEDSWDRSPWLQRELPAVAKFGTRALVVRYLDKEHGGNKDRLWVIKAQIDIFCEHPDRFVEPIGRTVGWTRFQNAMVEVGEELQAAVRDGTYDSRIADWSAIVDHHWFEFGPPTARNRWPASRDVEPYAWYFATPVDSSTSPNAKALSRWSDSDLADHVAGVARASGAQIEERAVRALQEYLRLNRPDAIANFEALAVIDYLWAEIQKHESLRRDVPSLQAFMRDPSLYSNPVQSIRRLGWVRYGLDPKLVIGESPTTQRLQPF